MQTVGDCESGVTLKWLAVLLGLFALFAPSAKANHLEVDWAIRAGGGGADKVRGLAIADDGSIFVAGEFGQPSADLFGEETESAGLLDFVVAKLDGDGAPLWVATAGGAKIDRAYGVAPAKGGGCFVTGHFESAELDFGNEQVLKNRGDYDAFVACFDAQGKCQWAFSCGGGGYDYGHGIHTDYHGGCVVSGAFAATGHFADTTFKHPKGRRAFLMRVAADGEIRWVREAGAAQAAGTMSGHNVSCDPDGNVFMAGFQRGGALFSDSVSLPECKIQDVYVARYNLKGDVEWATGTGGKSDGLATSVAPDGGGGCYIGGMFKGELSLAEKSVSSDGGHDVYVARVDEHGRGAWLHHSGGGGTDYGLGMTVAGDGSGGCLMTGEFSEKFTVRGEGSNRGAEVRGEKDAFVTRYDKNGELLYVEIFGGVDYDLSYAIGAGKDGAVVISGAFRNQTMMGEVELKSRKVNDIFVTKLKGK